MTEAVPPIQAFVFDAYGTLFDVASPVAACAEALGEPAAALAKLWRDKQLQYTWLRTLQGRYADFAQVTADALDFALDTLGIHDAALRQRLLDAYRTPSAYPDAPATLAALHGRGFRLAILSNGTPEWLDTAVRASGLGASLDAVLSADTVGVYKPHPEVYRQAERALDLPAAAIGFVSSNGWDAHSASAYGLQVMWCNRSGQATERLPTAPAYQVSSLDALLDLPIATR
ncbi:(S)-2-haloacid dehalogenase [mine drainage metagenome]|uniref:(S)-2-haloacid dehalogenase n=1 Tax=mine drainage metagenome TaxID=410659 RepID=A0A1J5RVQ0_9ZZZZ